MNIYFDLISLKIKEKEKKSKRDQSAEEIAKIIFENMKINMVNPNIWIER